MTTPEELRILVAERVMGWEKDDKGEDWRNFEVWFDNGSYVMPVLDWNPLESWADAGRVIERMEGQGWYGFSVRRQDNGYRAFFRCPGRLSADMIADGLGPTKLIALCRAALEAWARDAASLGVEVE